MSQNVCNLRGGRGLCEWVALDGGVRQLKKLKEDIDYTKLLF